MPPPAKKPRKRSQAFGIPKTALLKTKIDQNSVNSPLLSLPREVRRRIWRLVLGDQVLHIQTKCSRPNDPCGRYCRCVKEKQKLVTFCCMLPSSEEDLSRRSKIPLDQLATTDEQDYGLFLDAAALRRLPCDIGDRQEQRRLHLLQNPHYQCHLHIQEFREGKLDAFEGHALKRFRREDHVVQAQILQVCRQVYIEANQVLWYTNTFSFRYPLDFVNFMADRNAAQKSSIRSLSLSFSCGVTQPYSDDSSSRATASGITSALTKLCKLHLYLEDDVSTHFFPALMTVQEGIQHWEETAKRYETHERFTDFKYLPLEKVTVVVASYAPGKHGSATTQPPWFHAERVKFSEYVRSAILDPDGPQKLLQQKVDEKIEREARDERTKLQRRPCERASTKERCDEIALELQQEKRAANKDLSGVPKARRPNCKAEHVCLFCFKELGRSREEARTCTGKHPCAFCLDKLKRSLDEAENCPSPGNCDSEHLMVRFRNMDLPLSSMSVLVHPEETINTILTRYEALSDNDHYPWLLRIQGERMMREETVQSIMERLDLKSVKFVEVGFDLTGSAKSGSGSNSESCNNNPDSMESEPSVEESD